MKIFLGLIFFLFLSVFYTSNTFAIDANIYPPNRNENTDAITITYTGMTNGDYWVCWDRDPIACEDNTGQGRKKFTVTGNQLAVTVCGYNTSVKEGACGPNDWFEAHPAYNVRLFKDSDCCVEGHDVKNASFEVNKYIPEPIELVSAGNPTPSSIFTIQVGGHRRAADHPSRNTYDIDIKGTSGTPDPGDPGDFSVPTTGFGEKEFGPFDSGTYEVKLYYNGEDHNDGNLLAKFNVVIDLDGGSISGGANRGGGLGSGHNPCSASGCDTAIGNVPTDLKDFAESILRIATGIAGGIALILMVFGSIQILTSQGDQQKLNGGRERIVAAVAGLLFLIFSTLILQFIGINLLGGIPGI